MVSDTTDRRFNGDDIIYDDSNNMITASNDDYAYWKSIQKSLTDPLSNEYCKYDNE